MLVAKIELKKKFTQVKKIYNAHIGGDLPKFMETGFQGKQLCLDVSVCVFFTKINIFLIHFHDLLVVVWGGRQ